MGWQFHEQGDIIPVSDMVVRLFRVCRTRGGIYTHRVIHVTLRSSPAFQNTLVLEVADSIQVCYLHFWYLLLVVEQTGAAVPPVPSNWRPQFGIQSIKARSFHRRISRKN